MRLQQYGFGCHFGHEQFPGSYPPYPQPEGPYPPGPHPLMRYQPPGPHPPYPQREGPSDPPTDATGTPIQLKQTPITTGAIPMVRAPLVRLQECLEFLHSEFDHSRTLA